MRRIKKECMYCGCKEIKREIEIKNLNTEHQEEVYEESCKGCLATIYGYSKRIK